MKGRATNNCAEIEAATEAVTAAKAADISRLCINTDSQFMINCMTKWLSGWKAKGWLTAAKEPVKNREELQALDANIRDSGMIVRWNHVKGHAGDEGNENADRLARMGAKRRD